MKKQHVSLTDIDRTTLQELLDKGSMSAKTFKRATALLELDRGKTLQAVAQTLNVNYTTLASWRDTYSTQGLKCLSDAPRSGRPITIDGLVRAKITALACSDAPEGYDHWSIRLLADKAVEMELCETISRSTVNTILKKTNSNRI